MLSNIESLTKGVENLTRKVNQLYAAVDKVGGAATKAIGGVQTIVSDRGGQAGLTQGSSMNLGSSQARFPSTDRPQGQQQNVMQNSMAQFSTQPRTDGGGGGKADFITQGLAGLGKMALAPVAGAYGMMPDLGLSLTTSVGYYQAALRAPGMSRMALETSMNRMMAGGMSSAGSGSAVAALLAARGFTPGSAGFNQIVGETTNAYKYLGIDNAAYANAAANMQTGAMSSMMYGLGISTYNAQTGAPRSVGEVARQIMNLTAPGGVSGPKAVQESLAYGGGLAATLNNMNLDPAYRTRLEQALIDVAAGKNPDAAQPSAGNMNDMLTSAGRMNTATSQTMTAAETGMLKGFENAADTVEFFNRQLKGVAEQLGYFKGLIGGVGGTPVGEGLATGISMFVSGVKDFVGAVIKFVTFRGGGGGTSGFGAAFGGSRLGGKGGGAPVSGPVSAPYGATDNSGIWASTNGKHTGVDYAVPIGTPVTATMGGVVSSINPGPDYGTAVVIKASDGMETLYGHLSSRDVNLGDVITPGQRIGKSGKSGNTTGPHLHYEVRNGKNNPIDPSTAFGLLRGSDMIGNVTAALIPGTSSGSASYSGILGTGEQQQWAKDLLGKLGAPATDTSIAALNTWMRFEGGHWKNSAHFNPLNTTLTTPGSQSINKVGVKSYGSWEQGLDATIQTLLGKSADSRGYTAIVDALKAGAPTSDILSAINNSAWRSGKTGDPGYKFPQGGGSSGYGASFTNPGNLISQGANTVNITVQFNEATDQQAIRFAKQVQKYLEKTNNNTLIGSD